MFKNSLYHLGSKCAQIRTIPYSLMFLASPVQAEFSFNFTPHQRAPDEIANEIGALCGRFGRLHCDVETRGDFLPEGRSRHATDWAHEIYTAPDGQKYWHNVIGDPAEGFAIEYYTAMGPVNPDFARGHEDFLAEINKTTNTISDGGGFVPTHFDRGVAIEGSNCWVVLGPACNPLGYNKYLQNNGAQNPSTVAMKMVLSDAEMVSTYEKSTIIGKPSITQIISTPEILMEFKADTSANDYSNFGAELTPSSDIAAQHVFVNKLTLANASTGNFDYATDAENGVINAGRVIYVAGKGWADDRPDIRYNDVVQDFADWGIGDVRIYDRGSYVYADEGTGFNLEETDWSTYMHPEQNPCGGGPWCDMTGPYVMPQ